MKNLLIYLSPTKWFDQTYNDERMAQTQIESALHFWNAKDILFVTNFDYEYKDVSATVLPDSLFCEADAKASKVNAIVHLLENKMLPDLTWFHDLDAFQQHPININLNRDLGITSYGYKPQWNTGSFFFKPAALDIFRLLKEEVYKRKANEEPVLWILTKYNVNNINSRYEVLNNTYNVGMTNLPQVLAVTQRPIHVVHFPAHQKDTYDMFKPIITQTLAQIIEHKYYR